MQSPKSETKIVTAAMAEQWLAHSVYERQRKRAEWHVKRLAMEMEKGRFLAGTQIHFGILNGGLKLVNGQHTLAAIVKSKIPLKLSILFTPVENTDELGQLYGRHDRGRSRTPSDAFLGMALAEKLDLQNQEVNAFGAALRWVISGFTSYKTLDRIEMATSLDFIAEHMEAWAPVARTYFRCVREANTGLKSAYRRVPVVAIGLATMAYQPDRAEPFWRYAAADDALARHDPRHVLNAYLRRMTMTKGDPMTYMRHVAACWNRYFEGGELQALRPSGMGKISLTLRGTPFKARDRSSETPEPEEAATSPSSAFRGVLQIGLAP